MVAASTSDSEQTPKQDHEDNTPLDISLLKELGKAALIEAFNSVNGAKTLVLDSTLAGPLGLVTEVALLKQHGVDKMYWLEPGPLSSTTTNVVYLCRPLIKWAKIIADQIKRHARESQKHTYTILLVPRTSTLVTRVLEEEGVLGEVTISSYNLQFIPLADDVISLENESAFREIWVDGDESAVYDSAQALITLQKLYGLFPRIVGKGDHAARLATLLTRLLPRVSSSSTPESLLTPSEAIDALIILDRRVDMITPLLTQLTYEGLIDETLGIKNSHVELPISLVAPPSASSSSPSTSSAPATSLAKEKTKKHHLTTSSDALLGELRDLNFSSVGKKLNQTARRLDEDYKSRAQAKTVAQLRDFVGKLGGLQTEHQSLRIHTGLSEMLVPFTRTEQFNRSLEIQQNLLASYEVSAQVTAIEEMIAQGAEMQVVLRLLCLASITAGGIKGKALESVKREILQAYGYHYLPLLLSLSSPSLSILLPTPLPPSTPASVSTSRLPFSILRKPLRLLTDDPEPTETLEVDISYVYSGYAPLSVRLVQCVAQKGGIISNPATEKAAGADKGGKKSSSLIAGLGKVRAHPIVGWKGFEDVVASIPGETFDIMQRGVGGVDSITPPAMTTLLPREQSTTTVVFFLGGCTYTEVAALRWASRQTKGRRFLVATTGMINGSSIINSIAGTARETSSTKEAGLSS